MWPKLLQQLLPQLMDALPHLKHVVPVADKLLSANAGREAALAAIGEDLRGGLGDVRSANAGLSRQINDLAAIVTPIEARLASVESKLTQIDTRLTLTDQTAEQSRAATMALGQSFVSMDREIRSLRSLLVATLVLVVLVALMLGWLLLTRFR